MMSMTELLAAGFGVVFEPTMFVMVAVAIVLGTIFGALPGVSATMAVALGLTFTYTMEPIPAIVFLTAIYCSSITGGSITAILFKIPGVPSSAPTTFDGYPMAQRGEAGKALGVALLASAIGGVVSVIAMFALSQPLTKAALMSLIILAFISSWNEYMAPLIFLVKKELYTVSQNIQWYMLDEFKEHNLTMAAATSAIVPVVILFIVGQKYFVEGIATSGVKG